MARGHRRQRIEELLAACATDVTRLEQGAAREVAASERLALLLCARATGAQEEEEDVSLEDDDAGGGRSHRALLRGRENGSGSGSDDEPSSPSPDAYALPAPRSSPAVRPMSVEAASTGGSWPEIALAVGRLSTVPSSEQNSPTERGRSGSLPNLQRVSPSGDGSGDPGAYSGGYMVGGSPKGLAEAGDPAKIPVLREFTATTCSSGEVQPPEARGSAGKGDTQSNCSGSSSGSCTANPAIRTQDTVKYISRARGDEAGGMHDTAVFRGEDLVFSEQQQQQQHDSNFSPGETMVPNSFSSTARADPPLPGAAGSPQPKEASPQDAVAVMAVQILEVMAQDNTVMECNLRDYDAALCTAMQEALHLRAEVAEMDKVQGHVTLLQDILSSEIKVHDQLREENRQLRVQNHELMTAIHEAVASDEDHDSAVLIEGLIMENTMLRSSLFTQDSVVIGADFRQPELPPNDTQPVRLQQAQQLPGVTPPSWWRGPARDASSTLEQHAPGSACS